MRRLSLATLVLAALALGPAHASAQTVGAPETHGPDPAAISGGRTAPSSAKPLARGPLAKALPATWCGVERTSDDTTAELPNGEFRYHAVYMVPADGDDRFARFASTIQADAFGASSLLESTYGRAIRYDLGTSCGPQYLDISVVRMRLTRAQLADRADSPTGTFDAASAALRAAGFDTIRTTDTIAAASMRTRNYVVWLDGPAPDGSCGQAAIYDDPTRAPDNLNNLGGKVAVVFRRDSNDFCSSNAVRHEIGHNLGALQPRAPHAFDGSHCDDAVEDTMCYSNAPQRANGRRGLFFDYGNDDYWDAPGGPPLPWWTVNLNRFLCADADCNVAPGAVETGTPTPPASDPALDAPATAARTRRASIRLRARRRHHGIWKVRVRATGEGRGVVLVRCRRRVHGHVRTVLRRSTRLPRTIKRRVRCRGSRPHAKLRIRR